MVTRTNITVLSAQALPGGPPSGCLCLPAFSPRDQSQLSYQKTLFVIYRITGEKDLQARSKPVVLSNFGFCGFFFFYKKPFSHMKSVSEPPFVRHGKVELFCVKMRRVPQTPLFSLLFTHAWSR